jgi:hypothetical protein
MSVLFLEHNVWWNKWSFWKCRYVVHTTATKLQITESIYFLFWQIVTLCSCGSFAGRKYIHHNKWCKLLPNLLGCTVCCVNTVQMWPRVEHPWFERLAPCSCPEHPHVPTVLLSVCWRHKVHSFMRRRKVNPDPTAADTLLHHLSPTRSNVINPYPANEENRVSS